MAGVGLGSLGLGGMGASKEKIHESESVYTGVAALGRLDFAGMGKSKEKVHLVGMERIGIEGQSDSTDRKVDRVEG